MKRYVLAVIAFLYVGNLHSNDWNTSFAGDVGEQLESHLDSDGIKTIIAPAGENLEDAQMAASALQRALVESLKCEVAMADDTIGDLSTATDEEIVERSVQVGVIRVLIVRVFAEAGGKEWTAVATLYNEKSEVVAGLSRTREETIATDGDTTADEGVSTRTLAIVDEVEKEAVKKIKKARGEYNRKYIWYESWYRYKKDTGTVVRRWIVPYQGKYKKPLKGSNFYKTLERPDLAREYRKRIGIIAGLVGGGAAVSGAGLSVFFTGYSKGRNADDCLEYGYNPASNLSCKEKVSENEDISQKMKISGGIVAGAGLLIMSSALFVNPHPISTSDAREMVDLYNKKLKEDLGLEDTETTEKSYRLGRMNSRPKLSIQPVIAKKVAGFNVTLTF